MNWWEELVKENCREDPVCLKCIEGLVTVNNRSSSVLRGELVNENRREEPVCLKCIEGLVTANNWSSSVCVEGRARQREL